MPIPSTMLPLGTVAPDFELTDTCTHNRFRMHGQPAVATVLAFICNHCPSVIHMIDEFVAFASAAQKRGVRVLAICSNDSVAYPQDAPEKMLQFATEHGFTFPYLVDETQQPARDYQAACTPDLYVFDADLCCVYRGRFDESTPGNNKPVTGFDLREAIESILNGQPVNTDQFPSVGCSIKWRM